MTRAAIGAGDIGSPCQCNGGSCLIQGVPFPPGTPGGQITGCENVATSIPNGAVLMCLRSFYGQGSIPTTYFANGYCSLGATDCTGSAFCAISTFGTFDSMTSCPTGSVLITDSTPTAGTVLNGATLKTKVCAKSCDNDDNCRTTETDPVFNNAVTGYKCSANSDKCTNNTVANTAKFCYDPNNLSSACTVTGQ
jgi:hypothetical protein